MKTPPASDLLKKAAGVSKGSGAPNTTSVGQITKDQLKARFGCQAPCNPGTSFRAIVILGA